LSKSQKFGAGKTATEIRIVDLDSIDPAPYNPREISADALDGLGASIERFGFVDFLVVNKRTKRKGWPAKSRPTIVGGHQRCAALLAAGAESAPAVMVDLEAADEKALNIELNNPAVAGEWTADLFDQIDELRGELGNDELVELKILQLRDELTEEPPPDNAGGGPSVTRVGDAYRLGPHVLICGDPAKTGVLDMLCDLDRDPPLTVVVATAKKADAVVATWQERTGQVAERAADA